MDTLYFVDIWSFTRSTKGGLGIIIMMTLFYRCCRMCKRFNINMCVRTLYSCILNNHFYLRIVSLVWFQTKWRASSLKNCKSIIIKIYFLCIQFYNVVILCLLIPFVDMVFLLIESIFHQLWWFFFVFVLICFME